MHFPKVVLLLVLALFVAACNRDPKVARQKYLDSGKRYYSNGKYKEASIMYRKALQQDMRFGEAYYQLGLSELKLGRPVEALRAFQRAVELDPENQDAPAKLAEIFLAAYSGDPKHPQQFLKEVEDLTKKLLDRNPKSYDGLRLRGYLNLTKRDLKGAITDFQAANAIKSDQSPLILVLAQSLATDGQIGEAEKMAKAQIEKDKAYAPLYDLLFSIYMRQKDPVKSEEVLKLKSSRNPKSASYIVQLAAFYYLQNKRPESQKELDKIISNPKDFPLANATVGDFYFRVRDFDHALEQYRKGVSADPKEKTAYQKRIVQVLATQGKNAEATQLVEEILKENPKDDAALAMRGSLALRGGSREQLQTAINDFQAVVTKTPENPVLRFEYARALLRKGDVDAAKVQLQEAIKLRPDYIPPKLAMTQIYLTKGDFANASQTANQILQIDPNNIPAKLLRSSAMIGKKEYIQARQELNALLEQHPALTDAQFQLGMVNFNEGKFKEAETTFRKLYQSAPQDPRGLMGTIQAMVSQKQTPQAMQLIKTELQKNPDRQDLHLALAGTAYQAGDYELAVSEYKNLMEKFPKDMSLSLRLGEVYRKKGDMESAISTIQKAQTTDPANPVTSLTLAMLYDAAGQNEKSKPYYERVLEREPDNPMALNNLAYILAEQGTNLDHALTMVQKAKQKLPNNPEVSDTLGWIYIKKNLSDSAISIFQDLTEKHPDRSTFFYHLAIAQYQKGDKPAAKKSLQTALTKNPPKPEEEKIRDLISKLS